jgi:hypothetical protein
MRIEGLFLCATGRGGESEEVNNAETEREKGSVQAYSFGQFNQKV